MVRVALTTFLKCMLLPTTEKARQYGRYSSPGGYDFYKSLKRGAASVTHGGKLAQDVRDNISLLKNITERDHNLLGFDRLQDWLKKSSGEYFSPDHATVSSPDGRLVIRIEPEIGQKISGSERIISIWNTQKPKISPTVAGIGVYLMSKSLAKKSQTDTQFCILDVRSGKLFGMENIPNDAELLSRTELAIADALLPD